METENLCTQKIPQQLHLEGLADFGSPQQKPKPQGLTLSDPGLSAKEKAKIRHAKWYRENRDRELQKGKERYEKNKEKVQQRHRAYYYKTKEQRRPKVQAYQAKNRIKISERQKQWGIKNRWREAAYQKKYREKQKAEGKLDAEKSRQKAREYYYKNKQLCALRKKRYYQQNKDKIRESQKRWCEKNRERTRRYSKISGRRYLIKYPEKNAAKAARQRAVRKNVTAPDANKKYISSFYVMARRVAKCLGIPHDVDHIVPIAAGGLHHEDNLQILPASINRRKGAKIAA